MDDKELLDYIIGIFPINPNCVALSQFHSLMCNAVLPQYTKLRNEKSQLLQEQDDGQTTG